MTSALAARTSLSADEKGVGRGSSCASGPSPPSDVVRSLESAAQAAKRARAKARERESKLLARLPFNQRLSLTREKRAMKQWGTRRDEWSSVSEATAGKIGKPAHHLMMNTASGQRERNEAYQLLQAAMPLHEKHGGDMYWEMSLRGQGERYLPVGNIFSGLYVKVRGQPANRSGWPILKVAAPPSLTARFTINHHLPKWF
jgi:hypothetical protein